jgi:hypothetical protein
MSKQSSWILARVRLGWLLLVLGIVVAVAGIVAKLVSPPPPFNERIITGVGILFLGVGIAYLVRYHAALKDENSAKRLTAEERDERAVFIRSRAGNRAFWVSTGLVYIGLMWSSFASRGDLPALDGDTLWFFLAGAMLVPFIVYIVSLFLDEQNS